MVGVISTEIANTGMLSYEANKHLINNCRKNSEDRSQETEKLRCRFVPTIFSSF